MEPSVAPLQELPDIKEGRDVTHVEESQAVLEKDVGALMGRAGVEELLAAKSVLSVMRRNTRTVMILSLLLARRS